MAWNIRFQTLLADATRQPSAGALALAGLAPSVTSGSANALQAAFAALSPGQWGQFTMSGFNADLVTVTPGIQFHILEYARSGYDDRANNRLIFDGHSHSSTPGASRSRTIFMSYAGVWTSLTPGLNTDNDNGKHTGCDFTVDPVTGDSYGRRYGPDRTTMIRPGGAGSWTSNGIADIDSGFQVQDNTALEWHSGLFSGGGGLVYGCEDRIILWNKATDSWSSAPSTPTYQNVMGSFNNVSLWCIRNGCVYMGGGNGGGPSEKWWRIGANGVPSALPDLPHSVSVRGGSGYAFPSVGDNWPLLVEKETGLVREFNDDTDSYTTVGDFGDAVGNLVSVFDTADGKGWFVIPHNDPNPSYRGLVFCWMTDSDSPVGTAEIWKPPTSS